MGQNEQKNSEISSIFTISIKKCIFHENFPQFFNFSPPEPIQPGFRPSSRPTAHNPSQKPSTLFSPLTKNVWVFFHQKFVIFLNYNGSSIINHMFTVTIASLAIAIILALLRQCSCGHCILLYLSFGDAFMNRLGAVSGHLNTSIDTESKHCEHFFRTFLHNFLNLFALSVFVIAFKVEH